MFSSVSGLMERNSNSVGPSQAVALIGSYVRFSLHDSVVTGQIAFIVPYGLVTTFLFGFSRLFHSF